MLLPIPEALCAEHYLNRNPDGSYSAGTALFFPGTSFSNCFPLLTYVQEELMQLVSLLHETCSFGALEGGNVLYVGKQDCNHTLRLLIEAGRTLPAYASAIGKALQVHSKQAGSLIERADAHFGDLF